ncbi:NAD(P)/FAD-dependent oxidoreductase [Gordonia oryzae]|uniref:NADH:ubiquinone reductase (non-electrogenic) n=1 Tax=Gordonia oryzae TaxID=2487349 RepID=A0A3N4GRL0_9ACTN|nr:NAD(P)/FAD-dependent oxidoreductase [Gordonia oryzae]RPA64875.1 NAD(P)/FAD-dependent oxidoreductase [Gordonia oryzae]
MNASQRGRNTRPHVVILGAGFAGIHAARSLRRAKATVTVIDRGTSHLFQPLLYQCATGLLSEGSISSPIRHLLRKQRNADVYCAEATDIDPEARTLTVTRLDSSIEQVGYDYLVVAVGMRTAYHGNEHLMEHTIGMKTLDDALAIRRQVMGAFEVAETLPDPDQRKPWLTFAIAGGGPTGVELAGQIRELAHNALAREFRSIDPDEARVMLFQGADRLLPSFSPSLSTSALRTLERLGVETHFGVHVTDVGADTVEITEKESGAVRTFGARTTLWTTGVEAVPFVKSLADAVGLEQEHDGTIPVADDLSVPGHPDIFVVGDVSSYNKLPGVAEVAMQGGRHAGEVIAGLLAGGSDRPGFRYRDFGSAAYISRKNAILEAGPLRLSGRVGWFAWGAIHIAFLAGIRNRTGTLVTWAATLLTDTRRERAFTYGDPKTARKSF